jgi:hypothetical protein
MISFLEPMFWYGQSIRLLERVATPIEVLELPVGYDATVTLEADSLQLLNKTQDSSKIRLELPASETPGGAKKGSDLKVPRKGREANSSQKRPERIVLAEKAPLESNVIQISDTPAEKSSRKGPKPSKIRSDVGRFRGGPKDPKRRCRFPGCLTTGNYRGAKRCKRHRHLGA